MAWFFCFSQSWIRLQGLQKCGSDSATLAESFFCFLLYFFIDDVAGSWISPLQRLQGDGGDPQQALQLHEDDQHHGQHQESKGILLIFAFFRCLQSVLWSSLPDTKLSTMDPDLGSGNQEFPIWTRILFWLKFFPKPQIFCWLEDINELKTYEKWNFLVFGCKRRSGSEIIIRIGILEIKIIVGEK